MKVLEPGIDMKAAKRRQIAELLAWQKTAKCWQCHARVLVEGGDLSVFGGSSLEDSDWIGWECQLCRARNRFKFWSSPPARFMHIILEMQAERRRQERIAKLEACP